ncbi:MAG: calcium/sodium antiporter [Bacteroidota bacterium]
MGLLASLGLFIVSLGLLIKASDWFITSAERIGRHFGIPSFIIGLTIVAAGTSLPELASSLVAVLQGSSEFVSGNVIGSNITNIFLVLGVSAVIAKRIDINYNLLTIDIPMLLGSSFLLFMLCKDGRFSLGDAIISLLGMVIFLGYTINSDYSKEPEPPSDEMHQVTWKTWGLLLLSGVTIYFGADYTIKAVSKLAEIAGIGKDIIALSLVAFGTSVPELIVSAVAARKGNPEIAIGNILGSNIFNTFAVMGIPGLIGSLTITSDTISFSLPLMLIATILFMIMTMNRKVSNWEGWILLLFYAYFVYGLFELNFFS